MAAWELRTAVTLDEVNVHLAALEDAGLLGVVEEAGRATVYLNERVDGLPLAGEWAPVPERDWATAWRTGLQPVTVGDVVVTPPWLRVGAPATVERVVVEIEPGQAFGTGHHETTAGCLAALQELPLAGRRVLDVGTGSGVLAITAAKLGASTVVAVDTDPVAVATARANAAANAAAVAVIEGPAAAAGAATFDVVVANLDTVTLSALAADLAAALAPDGTLVASGVSVERQAEAASALQRAGLMTRTRPGREWVVLLARRRDDAPLLPAACGQR